MYMVSNGLNNLIILESISVWYCRDFASNHIEFQLVSKDHNLLERSSHMKYPLNIRILIDVSVKHSLNHRYSSYTI